MHCRLPLIARDGMHITLANCEASPNLRKLTLESQLRSIRLEIGKDCSTPWFALRCVRSCHRFHRRWESSGLCLQWLKIQCRLSISMLERVFRACVYLQTSTLTTLLKFPIGLLFLAPTLSEKYGMPFQNFGFLSEVFWHCSMNSILLRLSDLLLCNFVAPALSLSVYMMYV